MYELVAPAAVPRVPLTKNWNEMQYAIQEITELAIHIHTTDAESLGKTISLPVREAASFPSRGSSAGSDARIARITSATAIASEGWSTACAPVTSTTPIPEAIV